MLKLKMEEITYTAFGREDTPLALILIWCGPKIKIKKIK